MKKLLWLIIVLLVAVLMNVTRPDKKAHKEAMMKAVKELVDEEAQNRGFRDNGLTRFGKSLVNKAIETALNSKLKVDDYYLFNTTHVRLKGEDKLLSVGLFGHVFTFDKEMLREAIEEGDDAPEPTAEEKAAAKAEKQAERQARKEQRKKERQQRREQRKKEREARKQEQQNAKAEGV